LGGGTLRGTGSVRLATPSEPASYRFQTLVKEVTLRYPEGWWLRGDGELTLQSNPAGRIVRGVLDLAQVAYVADVNVGFNQLMRGFFAKPRVEVADTDELFSSTQLNVALRAPGTFRVSNNLAKLRGSADLVLRGTLANPVIVGLVEVQPGGTLVYGDNDYVIEEARLNFANPFRMEPLIDLKARTRINPYDVTLNLVGTPERLNASFSSDPPIADIQILSLLAGGEVDAAADSVAQTATPGEAGTYDAQAFLMGQAASFVGQRVNTLFGFDRFRVAPLTNTSGDLSTIRVTVGKRLGKDLYATYTVDPSDTSSQLLQVEWRVASGLSLVFTQEGRGSYAVDARWETTF
jgi:translocation and assembly module TamB